MDEAGYRSLVVWQKAMDFVEEVYRVTDLLPDGEKFGLVSQLQRSSVSVPSNIAEGYARTHLKDYLRILLYAKGSLAEAETQVMICVRTRRIDREDAKPAWALAQEVGRLLSAIQNTLSSRVAKP